MNKILWGNIKFWYNITKDTKLKGEYIWVIKE